MEHGNEGRHRMTHEELFSKAIELYTTTDCNTTIRSVSKELGIKEGILGCYFRFNGVKTKPRPFIKRRKITKEEINAIIDSYGSGNSSITTGKMFNRSEDTIRMILKENGVKLRGYLEARKRCKINEHVFDEITPESAYWIGFLMVDGCVSGGRVSVSLNSIDKGHVDKFKNFLGSSHAASYTKDKKFYRICLSNKTLADSLFVYNVIPRKSLVATPPESLKNNRDFWRGMVDGDGSLWFSGGYYSIGMYGTKNIVSGFRDFITSRIDMNFSSVYKGRVIYGFQTCGKKAKAVVSELYKDAVVSLERKQKIADIMM